MPAQQPQVVRSSMVAHVSLAAVDVEPQHAALGEVRVVVEPRDLEPAERQAGRRRACRVVRVPCRWNVVTLDRRDARHRLRRGVEIGSGRPSGRT